MSPLYEFGIREPHVLLAYDRVLLVPRFTRSHLVIADNSNNMSTLLFDFSALCSNDDLLVNGTGANNTRAPKESVVALISS